MLLRSSHAKRFGFAIGVCVLAVLFASGNVFGYANTTWATIADAYLRFNGSNEHVILRDIRLPRAVVGLLVGAALAVSGTIMQALTRNPMASPGVLGVNAGAAFFIVCGISLFGATSHHEFVWLALAGAAVSSVAVYAVGSVGIEGMTPLKLTLAGATIAALFSSFTTAILVTNEGALDNIFFWLAGSVDGRKMEQIVPLLPLFAVGFVLAFSLSRALNVIAVGEDVAKGLGQNTFRVKLLALLAVVLLAGGSVAAAGPIGFVGLVIPHIVRGLVGIDHRYVVAYSAVFGAILLLAADIGARFVAFPKEVPVGVMTAIIGAPFFIYLARKELAKR